MLSLLFLFALCALNQAQRITETQVTEFLFHIIHIFYQQIFHKQHVHISTYGQRDSYVLYSN